jgi:hypothetical protein
LPQPPKDEIMNRTNKKTNAINGRKDGRNALAMRTASLSARDPLAYAAALNILG